MHFVGCLAVFYYPVWRFQESVFIGTRIDSQRVDQANVRAFRGFDRADASIVRRMYVTHFETGALAGQTTWTQR